MNELIKAGVEEYFKEHLDIIKKLNPQYSFRQFFYDLIIISMISLALKVIIALSVGNNIINLY